MKKIEIIWRELLYQAIEKGNREFIQKEVAQKFGFSTSTVFQALKAPRKMGAVRVTGRNFFLEDPEKLLYHWASVRDLKKDIIFSARSNLPIFEIEGRMPSGIIFAGFSAAREILKDTPADYDQVYIYLKLENESEILEEIKKRFEIGKGVPNLNILKGDRFLENYGQITTWAQTFVDLWNLPLWYAKEYVSALKEKIES